MATPTKNDVLASNLLFTTLGLIVLLQVAGWVAQALNPHQTYFHSVDLSGLGLAGIGVLLLLRGALYYIIRLGFGAAKIFSVLGFTVSLYTTTHWQQGMVVGVDFAHFSVASLVMLLNGLLTLAALVLMFKKPRAVSVNSLYA